MKAINNPEDRISFYHLMALLISLPFDMFYSHLILISFTLHTLIHLRKNILGNVFSYENLVLSSVFSITIISTIYATNRADAFNEWGRRLVILICPFVLAISNFDLKKYRSQLMMGFAVCCTFTVAYLYIDALRIIRFYNYPLKTLFSPMFTNHNFSEPIGMHATFFSLQLCVAVVYLLTVIINKAPLLNKLLYSACCLIITGGLLQLCSKSAFVVMFLVINFAFPWFYLKGQKRIFVSITGTVATLFAVMMLLQFNTFRERYFDDLKNDLSQRVAGNTTDSRLARWEAAADVIKTSPFIGHGAGSEIPLLKQRYFEKKLYNSFLNGLNAHNQYLSMLIKSGMIGLIIFITTIVYGIQKTVQTKDILFLTFIMLVAVVSISENLLDVDKGTIFYGLFFSFFVYSASPQKRLANNTAETINNLRALATSELNTSC